MKKISFLLVVIIFALQANAQPPKVDAQKGMIFGKQTADVPVVEVDKMPALVVGEPQLVKVKGKVIDVCKAEGCWLKMETAKGPMMIKMKDHAFLVPVSLEGKTIVAEGMASVSETSVAMLRHYAEDAGKSKEEIDAIKAPKTEMKLDATGILVL